MVEVTKHCWEYHPIYTDYLCVLAGVVVQYTITQLCVTPTLPDNCKHRLLTDTALLRGQTYWAYSATPTRRRAQVSFITIGRGEPDWTFHPFLSQTKFLLVPWLFGFSVFIRGLSIPGLLLVRRGRKRKATGLNHRTVSSGFKWFQVVSSGFKWFQVVSVSSFQFPHKMFPHKMSNFNSIWLSHRWFF